MKSTYYTLAEWQTVKAKSADRWRRYSINPYLPADYQNEKVAFWLAYEEGADTAIDLIKAGHSLEDAAHMAADFIEWKLGGAA